MSRRRVLLLLFLASLAALAWLVPWSRPAAPGLRTILLLAVDTLRRDRVDAYGRSAGLEAPLTPRMDALAARGVRFTDARTPVPLTLPAHVTMLTGLPPAESGVRLNTHGRIPGPQARGFPLLTERLREGGWRTGAFVSASPLAAGYGLDQGFERYDDETIAEPSGLLYAERPGEETVARALAWLDTVPAGDRAFLFVHLFEPHAPYAPDAPVTLDAEARYDLDVARADMVVGRLLDGLAARGRGEAAVLLVADHGEALDDLGERTHGLLLGDAVLRIPLLLAAPGLRGGVRDDPVDIADVAPTLAALAGVPWPGPEDRPGRGLNLLAGPAPEDRVRVAESLYAHHLHRWAQLLAAIAPDGTTLVDVGQDRLHVLAPAPFLEPQAAPLAVAGRPGLARLGAALAAYREGERRERMTSGGVAGGYGHAARVAPFLPPSENARLADPYAVVDRQYVLDLEKQRLFAGAPPQTVVTALDRLLDQDPDDLEVLFWLGQAWTEVARRGGEGADEALESAEAAYLAAWAGGRRDGATLALAAGVNADGREEAMLLRLEDLGQEVAVDCRLAVLRARLLRALPGRSAEAEAACRDAEALCQTPSERALFERVRAAKTCR